MYTWCLICFMCFTAFIISRISFWAKSTCGIAYTNLIWFNMVLCFSLFISCWTSVGPKCLRQSIDDLRCMINIDFKNFLICLSFVGHILGQKRLRQSIQEFQSFHRLQVFPNCSSCVVHVVGQKNARGRVKIDFVYGFNRVPISSHVSIILCTSIETQSACGWVSEKCLYVCWWCFNDLLAVFYWCLWCFGDVLVVRCRNLCDFLVMSWWCVVGILLRFCFLLFWRCVGGVSVMFGWCAWRLY